MKMSIKTYNYNFIFYMYCRLVIDIYYENIVCRLKGHNFVIYTNDNHVFCTKCTKFLNNEQHQFYIRNIKIKKIKKILK